MTVGVYMIYCSASGKSYVGSSQDIDRRRNWHLCILAAKKHHSLALQRAWNKYGPEEFDFTVLERCSLTIVDDREQFWLDQHGDYNCHPKANTARGFKHRPDVIQKMRNSHARFLEQDWVHQNLSIQAKRQHAAGKFGRTTWKPETIEKFKKKPRLKTKNPCSKCSTHYWPLRKGLCQRCYRRG